MEDLPIETRDEFYSDFVAIQEEMRSCVVDKRSRAADRDWRKWVGFCATHNLDPDDTTVYRTSRFSPEGSVMDASHPVATPFDMAQFLTPCATWARRTNG